MGGRGASSVEFEEWAELERARRKAFKPDTKYNYTTSDELPAGADHAFFSATNRAFTLITYSTNDDPDELGFLPEHTFGQEEPTIRWMSDGQVNDVYIMGMTSKEFFARSGLEFNLDKGGYVLSKRVSRCVRDYYVQSHFNDDEVKIHYLPQDDRRDAIWDGAGLISRQMLRKMRLGPLEAEIEKERDENRLSKLRAKHTKLSRELKTATRVEYTIQSEKGQDKGHAMVADELFDDDGNEVDFICLDSDTKTQVRLTNGQKWVGINFVHGHDHMRLDIQSLIHMQEFFDVDRLDGYVQEEARVFSESINSGAAAASMRRIDRNETAEQITNWPVREFVVSGGDVRWSPYLMKIVTDQHLKRLNNATLEKLRVPVPGGRYYVMPAEVGRQAGLEISVGRGKIKVDLVRGTAWVNDEDWLEMPDSPKDPETGKGEGLASIWGGGDNDDALWIYQFTDEADGEKKVLAWRSPNQLGEYAVLSPTKDTPDLKLETVDGEITYPPADSRDLPLRTDFRPKIKSQIDPDSAGGVGEDEQHYLVSAMDKVHERAKMNAGVVGLYCNALMLHKAIFHTLPDDAPAPLEDVIDGAVKTGAELRVIKEWCIAHSKRILRMGVPIPKVLQERVATDRDRDPSELVPPIIDTPRDSTQWMDLLVKSIGVSVKAIETERDQLTRCAAPPARLLDHVFREDSQIPGLDTLEAGAALNRTYTYINNVIRKEKTWDKKDKINLRLSLRSEIDEMTPDQRRLQLRQFIYEDKFRLVAKRTDGYLGRKENEEAIRLADEELERVAQQNRGESLLQKKLFYKREWAAKNAKENWTSEDHDRVRDHMHQHLAHHHPDSRCAILRGAIASAYMNDTPMSDAAVWVPGTQTPDGRLPGVAETTLSALREIGLLNEIGQSEDGVIVYPSEIVSRPTYQSIGIKNAWFGIYQQEARDAGLPVPERPQDVDSETRKEARKQFKKTAPNFSGQEVTVREEVNGRTKQKELIAYIGDNVRLGVVSNSSGLADGHSLHIKCSFARSSDLRVAYEPEVTPVHQTSSDAPTTSPPQRTQG